MATSIVQAKSTLAWQVLSLVLQDRGRLLAERQKLAELLEQSDQLLNFSKHQQAQADRQHQELMRMTESLVKAQQQRKQDYVEAQVGSYQLLQERAVTCCTQAQHCALLQGKELGKALEENVVAGLTETMQQQFNEVSHAPHQSVRCSPATVLNRDLDAGLKAG